jgi:hypothetical protein
MDPDSCIKRIIQAIEKDDLYEADCALVDLSEWLLMGGFSPSTELMNELNSKLEEKGIPNVF